MLITTLQRELMELAPRIHETNVHKGFWPKDRNKGEQVMLIVSELGECLDAHREGNWYRGDTLATDFFNGTVGEETPMETWRDTFKQVVKSTVQDEMADVVIRLLDYIFGWDIRFVEREYRKNSTGNFGHDLLRINWYIMCAYHGHMELLGTPVDNLGNMHEPPAPGKDWGYALAAILKFCEWNKIDIMQHVLWKMRYNGMREHMHGKAY